MSRYIAQGCQFQYPEILGPGELCGLTADPKSLRLVGQWLCEYHLSEELRRSM
jgi:hypothetical protein